MAFTKYVTLFNNRFKCGQKKPIYVNTITLKQSVKIKRLRITVFVLFSLFISENVFTVKTWEKHFVDIEWDDQNNIVLITAAVYDYKFGPESGQGYLERCTFEASADGRNYYKLMHIHTKRQIKSNTTLLYLNDKLDRAKIQFLSKIVAPPANTTWAEKIDVRVIVCNDEDLALLSLGWHVGNDFKDVRYIRIKGRWTIHNPNSKFHFNDVVYDLNSLGRSALKSNMPEINEKESEAVVIKGAGLSEKIKLYTTSGAEIKTVVSNNDVFKIKLPSKQIYHVRVGKSLYKVAL